MCGNSVRKKIWKMKPRDTDRVVLPRPTELAQKILREVIRNGDQVLDATAGNGYDTLFLAQAVGNEGRVIAFDISKAAIDIARARLVEAGMAQRVTFWHDSHTNIAERIGDTRIAVAMWNLGYFPGGDRESQTKPASTIVGLDSMARVLKSGGCCTILCYPGHSGGGDELDAVGEWLEAKSHVGWKVARYELLWTQNPAPVLFVVVAN